MAASRRALTQLLGSRPWRRDHVRLWWRHLRRNRRPATIALDPRQHVVAAAQWLAVAQDATGDGGVAGRYRLGNGWSSSYPETTGYLIPTFLALARSVSPDFEERSSRCVAFLLPLQLSNGSFPGGEVADNRSEPSVFNTAQILGGLTAWHRHAGDQGVLDAASRAARWLVQVQDDDGAWRRFTYGETACAYYAHAACWLAEFGAQASDEESRHAASRHLEWVLGQQDRETGWFDRAGFPRAHTARTAITHTLGYTLWGVLRCSELLQRSDGIRAVREAASKLADVVHSLNGLPGELDGNWRPRANYACLTGNAQLAQVWLALNRREEDRALVQAADTALAEVRAAQAMDLTNPALLGAIPGSNPLWGGYLPSTFPNWAAKFFIDAELERIP